MRIIEYYAISTRDSLDRAVSRRHGVIPAIDDRSLRFYGQRYSFDSSTLRYLMNSFSVPKKILFIFYEEGQRKLIATRVSI